MKTTARKNKNARSPYLLLKKLNRAAEIAYYYNFMPIEAPVVTNQDVKIAKQITESETHEKNYGEADCPEMRICAEEKVALIRTCEERKLLNPAQATMLYYEGPIPRVGQRKTPKNAYKQIHLDILGTSKSIAEAELIKASLEILREKGYKDLYIDINSVGDKDTLTHFTREVNQFYRKHADMLQTHCRTALKKDLFAPLECTHEKCVELANQAPKSVSSLTETSRAHFTEVLEYIESMNVPYKIDNHLLGNRRVCSHTIFLIKTLNAIGKEDEPEVTLGLGYRMTSFAKKMESKRDLSAAGVTLIFKETRGDKKASHKMKKPQVYFIQIGFDAKRKSLDVIEALRHAKIPVHQSLAKDKLSSQIATAENMKVPYVVIIGQKEALEGNAIVRDMSTRSQETISLQDLPAHLKALKA